MITREEFARIAPGDTISYRLKSADSPTNTNRVWRGCVRSIHLPSNTIAVILLDQGYEGESERVSREQIVVVEHRGQREARSSS